MWLCQGCVEERKKGQEGQVSCDVSLSLKSHLRFHAVPRTCLHQSAFD